jgi:hypothetical protein
VAENQKTTMKRLLWFAIGDNLCHHTTQRRKYADLGNSRMPSLTADIVGRVERRPLRPSADNSLMPLFEAVHNALHAVDDLYLKDTSAKGPITVTVLRKDFAVEDSEVTGFVIEDNGIGLDDTNYASFLRPDSPHEVGRGGKGIGRLGWLKVFSTIEIDSTFASANGLVKRSFNFRLSKDEQIVICKPPRPVYPLLNGTRITLRDYKGSFIDRCPTDPDVILQKLASHFLLYVVADQPISVLVEDGSLAVTLAQYYGDFIGANDLDEVDVVIETEEEPQTFDMRHLRVAKKFKPAKGFNRMLLFGNDRADESGLDASWRGEGEASNTVVLIEFKRPNRNSYSGNDNPVRQIRDYVEKLKTSNSVTDARGRTAPSCIRGAAYHCYIIADLTDTLLREIRDLNLKATPDDEGRFGHINDGGVYIEIIPYGKFLQDAKLRRGIFFQKLGLTDLDPTAVREAEALAKVVRWKIFEQSSHMPHVEEKEARLRSSPSSPMRANCL